MPAISLNGRFAWPRTAKPEFTTQQVRRNGSASVECSSDQRRPEINATFTWVAEDFLAQQKVEAWSDMPVWTGKESGLARTKIDRALSKGLTFRPLGETARDTLAWFKSLPQDRQSKLRAGLTPEREAEVLAQWRKQLG